MTKTGTDPRQAQVQSYQNPVYDCVNEGGFCQMGSFATFTWRNDPRHLLFSMARYKFVCKMLAGKSKVLEVGCGDAFGLPIMLQTVERVHGIDNEPTIVDEVREMVEQKDRCSFEVHDMTKGPLKERFEAAYSMDVIEHIEPAEEHQYMQNIAKSLLPHGVCIIGTPNVTAEAYASDISNEGHVNLKSGESLRDTMAEHFHNAFLFSMNDEVVHTGYSPMAHYVIAMGVDPKIG